MNILYPAIKPNKTQQLAVAKPHVLYLEESGIVDGIPVIMLHSGPGAGGDTHLRRFFDPLHYRIIIFDQRGCGRSTPNMELNKNTTKDLLDDIETIRHFLGLQRFVLCGGGWGSLLALLYAELYPQYVSALLLYQIFLGRKEDIEWFYSYGASNIFPDYWAEFTQNIPFASLESLVKHYQDALLGQNDLARLSAAKAWAAWQAHCSSLQPHLNVIDQHTDLNFAQTLALIETHYLRNNYFINENTVIKNAHKIRHLPTYLIHGRYNIVCPLSGAWLLHRALPASRLSIIRDAGHSDREAGVIDEIINASREIIKHSQDVG